VSLASDKRVTFKRSVEEEKEGAILISKGIVFQAERTTMVETLQWMPIRDWNIQGASVGEHSTGHHVTLVLPLGQVCFWVQSSVPASGRKTQGAERQEMELRDYNSYDTDERQYSHVPYPMTPALFPFLSRDKEVVALKVELLQCKRCGRINQKRDATW
jgi:hypothetical protein